MNLLTPEVKVNIDLISYFRKKSLKLFCTFAKNTMDEWGRNPHYALILQTAA